MTFCLSKTRIICLKCKELSSPSLINYSQSAEIAKAAEKNYFCIDVYMCTGGKRGEPPPPPLTLRVLTPLENFQIVEIFT